MISTRGTHRLQRTSVTELLRRVLGLPPAALIRRITASSAAVHPLRSTDFRHGIALRRRGLGSAVVWAVGWTRQARSVERWPLSPRQTAPNSSPGVPLGRE